MVLGRRTRKEDTMSSEPEVTPLFSRCAGVLSTVCENFLPRHPRLAGVLSGRFAALNVSPMTAERFLKTLVEQAELETLCDLDLVASVKLEQEIAKAGYYALCFRPVQDRTSSCLCQ